ncbi:MAG: energy-coupling factor transporter transmembrane component T [Candidatus Nanopelagicales bacterium]
MTKLLLHHDRLVRWLHPVAWWTWAVGAASAASITGNPLVMLGISTAALLVIMKRGASAPWAASVVPLVQLAGIVVFARILMQALIGAPMGTHILLHLPQAPLPGWLTGVRLGGPLTLESLLLGSLEGLRFAAVLLCIAAASTVAAPSRLFRSLPSRADDVGTLLIVAGTLVPHLVQDFRRVSAARRLRGRHTRGVRAAAASLTPVVDAALERSMQLAASMFSRGYGLDVRATHHRPDPWRAAETAVAASGPVSAALVLAGIALGNASTLSIAPLQWPTLPLSSALAILAACLPAFLTPETPTTDRPEPV